MAERNVYLNNSYYPSISDHLSPYHRDLYSATQHFGVMEGAAKAFPSDHGPTLQALRFDWPAVGWVYWVYVELQADGAVIVHRVAFDQEPLYVPDDWTDPD